MKSIQRFSERHIPVTVLTVISKFNYFGLFEFFTTAWEKGIKQVLFQPVISYSNYPDQPPVDDKSQLNVSVENMDILVDELKKILQFERKHRIKTNVYRIFPWIKYYLATAAGKNEGWFFNDVLDKFYCREIYAIIDISYDGGIQPCGLVPASGPGIKNRQPGLIPLWLNATRQIRDDLHNGRFYDCCNGCCHHFSRNMLASVFKHPVKNRSALIRMIPLVLLRIQSEILKKLNFYRKKPLSTPSTLRVT